MAIDAALGRLGNKSGVCTSSTRPTNPFEGQLIYETDTNRTLVYDNAAWVVIANASATNFPTSLDTNTVDSIAALQAKVGVDGSAVTSSLDYKVAQQGLTFIKSQAIGTAVSSVTVTNAFSSTFDNYRVICNGGGGSTAGELQLQMGSTTTGYYSQIVYTAWASPWTPTGTGSSNFYNFNLAGTNDPGGTILNLDIFNPYVNHRTVISGGFTGMQTTRAGGYVNGFLLNGTSYTDFTILVSTGTMSGGTIRVYGYNKG